MVQPPAVELQPKAIQQGRAVEIQLLTEGAVKSALLAGIDVLEAGDEIDMAMFAIADRHVVNSLSRADSRGVRVRLLLDPSKGAFGQEGNGMPNRQVANELMERSQGNTEIRWCNTNGEQCHSKLIILRRGEITKFFVGSANLTKRNLGNYNLESDALISGRSEHLRQWENETDRTYSVPLSDYQNVSRLQTIRYRVQEFTGLTRW